MQRIRSLPGLIQLGMALTFLNALLLLLWWSLFPSAVVSNGAQAFFILLWLGATWGIYLGEGWIRIGITAIVVAFIWGLVNQPSLEIGLSKVTFAEILSKVNALVVVILLYLPASTKWFRQARERKALELST